MNILIWNKFRIALNNSSKWFCYEGQGGLVLLNLLTRGMILDRLYASVYDAGSKSTLHMNILIYKQKCVYEWQGTGGFV